MKNSFVFNVLRFVFVFDLSFLVTIWYTKRNEALASFRAAMFFAHHLLFFASGQLLNKRNQFANLIFKIGNTFIHDSRVSA